MYLAHAHSVPHWLSVAESFAVRSYKRIYVHLQLEGFVFYSNLLLQEQKETAQELKEELTQMRLDQAEIRSQLEAKTQQLLEAQECSGKTAADAQEVRKA